MRLSDSERRAITQAVKRLDPVARVYLFGSRARDDLKGGDIDLLIVSGKLEFSDKLTLLTEIKVAAGDQKIDIIITNPDDAKTDPFIRSVFAGAIELS